MDGVQRGIPALAVRWGDSDPSCGTWRHCLALTHDAATGLWGLQWDGADEGVPLTPSHRMHVCFTAEDPVNAANRIAHAFEARQRAEAYLRWVGCAWLRAGGGGVCVGGGGGVAWEARGAAPGGARSCQVDAR